MSNCKTCKYWERSDISDGLLEQDEQGLCSGLKSGPYNIELNSDLIDNLTIDECENFFEEIKIITDYDFYCRNFKQKDN